MELCRTCQAAIEPGQPSCTVCGTAAPQGVDPTQVQPPGYTPPPGYQGGYTPPPGYPQGGYTPPPAYPQPTYPQPVYQQPVYAQPVYAQPVYAQPVVVAPTYVAAPVPVGPPKSKTVAALLCFFLGGFGIHRFYTGQTGLGVALLLTTIILGVCTYGLWFVVTTIWVLVDFILILTGAVRDQYGRELVW